MNLTEVFSQNILIRWLTGRSGAHDLAVTMSGIRLGERLLQIGVGDGRLLVALAAKIGMSGRSCGVDEHAAAVARAEAEAAREGVLLELHQARAEALPFEAGEFDVVVVNAPAATSSDVAAMYREAWRVLRPGGRCVVVMTLAISGRAGPGADGRGHAASAAADVVEVMRRSGFKAARQLAERNGQAFAEGVRSAA
jgi:ubiquinone/menaquinone biosynthesis C-methylase UbiE